VNAIPADISTAQRTALAVLRVYKIALSPLFAGSCRFLPSCSDYAAQAVREHGVLRGSWLAVGRLLRCHPLAAAGLDPVPPHRPRA
jgi:putative membrane protein insertion efficiency factor